MIRWWIEKLFWTKWKEERWLESELLLGEARRSAAEHDWWVTNIHLSKALQKAEECTITL